jgi:hypothetical protein
MLTHNEIPKGMMAIHDTTFANLEEARRALGSLAPSPEAIAGTSPWPRQPSTLLTTPRLVAAWSTCAIARVQASRRSGPPSQDQAPPAPTPAACPEPHEIRDFSHLVSLGIDSMTSFHQKFPDAYAQLKARRDQGNDPQGLRHSAYTSY